MLVLAKFKHFKIRKILRNRRTNIYPEKPISVRKFMPCHSQLIRNLIERRLHFHIVSENKFGIC